MADGNSAAALERAAQGVENKRRELERRLTELRLLTNPYQKLQQAPLIAATMFELLDHQAQVNQAAIAHLADLYVRTEALAAQAGCAFETLPAPGASS